ncbi:hypothetical protein WJU16_08185 [Chitinophaga pollutisoli]|uniref:DUF4843 domain-containing protein n=1 Tax=Chitinophaga pollutisoli TaxID=3133966 RepID=A0ABZ2YTD4_9BACT
MQKILRNRLIVLLLGLMPLVFLACGKDEMAMGKAMQVVVTGYNGSGYALQVSVDTSVYDVTVSNGSYIIKPASILQFYAVHRYDPKRKDMMLVITDTVTKAVVLSKPLPAAGSKAHFNFVYIDGKEIPSQPPVPDPNTNKLGFYVRYMEGDEPFDIFLYRLDETTGQEHRVYFAKNVKANGWVYGDFAGSEWFADKTMYDKAYVCFTKTGTTDQWAFRDSENQSRLSAGGMLLPLLAERGVVQQFFVTPGEYGLEVSRMFFIPDRVR